MNKKTLILWVIIAALGVALVYQKINNPRAGEGPRELQLGKESITEVFNQDTKKTKHEGLGKIGTSIPSALSVQDGEATITVKNTGEQAFVPYTLVANKEVYRGSRLIQPGEKVSTRIAVGEANECVTFVETEGGERFSVTSKLMR